MNTISDIWNGRFGLAKTYWLLGVLPGFILGMVLPLVKLGRSIGILVLVAIFVYCVIVNVGIWRAASEYEGAKLWAILAKIAVAITPVSLVIGTLAVIFIPTKHQPPKVEETPLATQTSPSIEKPISNPIASKEQNTSEDQAHLRKQGVGGSQSLSDVKSWGNEQLVARSLNGDTLTRAHAFAAMWQRQILHKQNDSPEGALFSGYSIVLLYLDKDNALCRPDVNRNGGIEVEGGRYLRVYPECFKK